VEENGIYRGLVSYGDQDFSRYLRRTFLHATGRSPE
jgi:dihydroxy-acid dehydratase